MKKMKWLRKLPILVLALIIAVSPLMMAVPVCASSNSVTAAPRYEGYDCVAQIYTVDEGGSESLLRFYFPSDLVVDPGIAQAFLLDFTTEFCACITSLQIQIDYPLISWVKTIGTGRISQTYDSVVNGSNIDFLYHDFIEVDTISASMDLQYAFTFYNSSCNVVNLPADTPNIFLIPFDNNTESVSIFSVFSGVGSWLSGAIQSASTMFWTAESGMTVLGYLAVASLALAVILLIFSLIAGWLKFH